MVQTAVAKSLFDTAGGELVLRVRGTARDGQVVRLRSAKCTIGSRPDCTLRICAPGVGPLHCLIFRGKRHTLVRRWGPDTRLNGRTFADAPLAAGDQLSVGTVDFEVLEVPGASSIDWEVERTETRRELDTRTAEIEALRAKVEALQAELETGHIALANERQQWEAQRGSLTAEQAAHIEQLDARAAELDVRQAELDARQTNLDAQQVDIYARQAEFDAQTRN
ncbi:MAG: hypothetical protein ABR915_23900, partial [Thermoguttaceae bacterium]